MLLIRFERPNSKHTQKHTERYPWQNRIVDIDGSPFMLSEGFLYNKDFRYKIPMTIGTKKIVGNLYFVVNQYEIFVGLLNGEL